MRFLHSFAIIATLGIAFVSSDPNKQEAEAAPRDKRASDNLLKSIEKKIILNEDQLPGIPDLKGNRCVTKLVTVKEIKYEREKQCKHILKDKCHLTYITDYHSTPQEKCDTNYVKDCHIVFKPVPQTEKVKKCHVPYIRECKDGNKGPDICKQVEENFCETRYEKYTIDQDMPKCQLEEVNQCTNKTIPLLNLPTSKNPPAFAVKETCEKWPIQRCKIEREQIEKVRPTTACKKVSKEMCIPNNCKTVEGPEICQDEVETIVQNIPEEECDLHPEENCKTVSALVPKLIPKKNCVKVPKEICVNVKSKPKEVPKTITKLWCYNPDDLRDSVSTSPVNSGRK